ncbi:MAG TPA: L,D-transpeptidase family protein [Acidimicrobiales bacterium]|nr:L,D-transpeptidase family protein [Acidimicrobiales bacterium]
MSQLAVMPSAARYRRIAVCVALVLSCAVLVAAPSPAGAQEAPQRNSVSAFGVATDHGPGGALDLNQPLIDIAPTPTGDGYWTVAGDGGVFTFGDARFYGSTGDLTLNEPVVAMAARSTGRGYWFSASDGGVFSFGDAPFLGSMGGTRLNQPVVGMAATPSGNGYWLVAADGGIFTFGDAGFYGSTGNLKLDAPISGMAPTISGDGYWLVARDGGVFTFGDARFQGSMGGEPLDTAVRGIAASATGNGYWVVSEDGQVYEFGVTDHGNAASGDIQPPTVAIAAHPDRSGYWLAHGERLVVEVEDRGPHVERLQRRLERLGYWVGRIDGVYGSLTEQAVYAFQKYEGLPVDGEMSRDDQRALDRAVRPRPNSSSGDLVEIDESRQLLFVVRDGRALWTYNVSTGNEEPYTHEGQEYGADTPNGRFDVYREIDGWRESSLGRLYRPKYFHTRGIAVHGYTFVPPYPASHGCVRVSIAAMDHIWASDLMPIGTRVWVYGSPPT